MKDCWSQEDEVKISFEVDTEMLVLEHAIEMVTSDEGAAPRVTVKEVWSSSARFIAVCTVTEYSW